MSLLRFFLAVFLMCGFVTPSFARITETKPPPLALRSLAEEIAPLLKTNTLPDSKNRKASGTTKKTSKKKVKQTPLTAVEESFSKRAGQDLRLFGYQQIGRHLNDTPPETGAVQDDMIVGAGDALLITFRGQRDDSRTYRITHSGELIIKGLEPIAAAGLSLGALQHAVETQTAKHLLNTTVFVSMKELRQITVTVIGEVRNPGSFTLSPFQTVFDALAMSRGITTQGSLRNIRLVRGKTVLPIDFYQLLLHGDLGVSAHLRDGDKIIVPVLGRTVAVAGDVKRPGIFEESPHPDRRYDTTQILEIAGGVTRPGANRFVKLSLTPYGEEKVSDLSPQHAVAFRDGDMLMVTSGQPLRINGIYLTGHVRQPGIHSLDKAPSLRALLSHPGVFLEGVYPLIGVVKRIHPKTLAATYLAFSPSHILQGVSNLNLTQRDTVMIFGSDDIRRIFNPAPRKPKTIPDLLAQRDADTAKRQRETSPLPESDVARIAPQDDDENPLLTRDVIRFLRDHAATVHGNVLHPGLYPMAEKTSLDTLLSVAGGLRAGAQTAHVEIILANATRDGKRYTVDLAKDEPETILVASRDKVSIGGQENVADAKPVEIFGDVKRPGFYDLRKGDTLLDLIDRAGGLNDTAYAPGMIFMRESERRRQLNHFRRTAQELDLAVANYYMKDDDASKNADKIASVQKIADEMRRADAVGRISVESDPEILRRDPSRAALLQAGDRIYIPRRPSTVSVMGEVLSPGALQFDPKRSSSDYIRQAGGMTRYADKGRAFVVFPDGSATPLNQFANISWKGEKGIPAGSTVIVPRDPKPFDFLQVAGSIGNILAHLAVTAVAVYNIQDPNHGDVYYSGQ